MKGKILVVDDEEAMRRSLADILRLEGYQVQALSNGISAIETLRQETFDLLLLDLKMPGMDGMDVLRNVTKIAPDTLVILLTAHGSLESAIEALRRDAYDYLLKPASPAQILKSVSGALAKRIETQQKRKILNQLDTSLQALKDVERGESHSPDDQEVFVLCKGIKADLSRREVWDDLGSKSSTKIKLTRTEGKLLKVLLVRRGQVMTHKELVLQVQGYDVSKWEAPEVLRPVVSRLRRKLAHFPGGEKWITNVRGTGYVFEVGD